MLLQSENPDKRSVYRGFNRFIGSYSVQFYLDKRTDNRCLKLTIRYNFNPARSKYKGTGAGNDVKGRL